MSRHVTAEIARQPVAWAKALDLLPEVADALPQPGERVAVIGCGTSWFMAQSYALLREGHGLGETDAFAAGQLPTDRRYDRVLAISRSGFTTEVVRAAAAFRDGPTSGAPFVALTTVRESPVGDVADAAVVLDFADEQAVVQTVFATTALVLLRGSLGAIERDVVAEATAVLDGDHPLPAGVDATEQLSFLGQDWAFGVAQEAALKVREAAQVWTEAYPQLEYRHGPIAIAELGRVAWIFGAPVEGITADIAATGATLVDDDLDAVADLVRAQLLAVRLAERRGLDPDRPRHLTRAVVLADR